VTTDNERLSNKTHDLGEFNKRLFLRTFPECINEDGRVDFDRLKLMLGESVETAKEGFGMRWPGRDNTIRFANAPSAGTLAPDRDRSSSFDSTKNLIVEGDNLEVLKLLRKSYQGKVKLIYIDPPYNTGNDFVYKDDFSDSIRNYLIQTGQIDSEGKRLSTNSETEGRFHTNWMNMMAPRLYLAKLLLTEDGLVFISIDRTEHSNLRKIGEEIFGAENLIGDLAVVNFLGGRSDSSHFATAHESLLVFAKNAEAVQLGGFELTQEQMAEYKMKDSKGPFKPETLRKRGSNSRREDAPSLYYPIYWNPKRDVLSLERTSQADEEILPRLSDGSDGNWRWGKEKFEKEGKTELIVLQTNGRPTIYVKQRLIDESGRPRTSKPKTIWLETKYNSGAGTRLINELDIPFTNPKPLGFVQDIVQIGSSDGDIVLDFFAGSGTTAHAVMAQNVKDGGARRYLLVQLPEVVESDSDAAKAGYKTISEITIERVRRSAKMVDADIKQQLPDEAQNSRDFGFRVLTLKESCIEDWDSNAASRSADDLLAELKQSRLKPGRSDEDVMFEVLVKYGVDLNSKVERVVLGRGFYWNIGGGELAVVTSKGLTKEDLHALANKKPNAVVILDEAFEPESLKTNARATFKDAKIELKTF
jgi:adenine-specific DNA-methyltransferase